MKIYLFNENVKKIELQHDRHFFVSIQDDENNFCFKGYQSLKGLNSIFSAILSSKDTIKDINCRWKKGEQKYDCSCLKNLKSDFKNNTGISIIMCKSMVDRDTCKGNFKGYGR